MISGALTDHDLFKGTNFGPLSRPIRVARSKRFEPNLFRQETDKRAHNYLLFNIFTALCLYAHLVTSRIFSMSVAKI